MTTSKSIVFNILHLQLEFCMFFLNTLMKYLSVRDANCTVADAIRPTHNRWCFRRQALFHFDATVLTVRGATSKSKVKVYTLVRTPIVCRCWCYTLVHTTRLDHGCFYTLVRTPMFDLVFCYILVRTPGLTTKELD